jgi:P-type Ca2+ transporter type 2C
MPENAMVTADADQPWFAVPVEETARALGADVSSGLTSAESAARLASDGPNLLPRAPRPSRLAIVGRTFASPMTLMLTVVAVLSFVIGQVETGILIAVLVLLNVAMGTQQELKARASVDALQSMHVPTARVLRGGALVELPATDLVVGDVVRLEAGDIVPADGRIVESARLEVAESALTGESIPVIKGSEPVADPHTPLGDRTSMVFQSTSVTSGSATVVVTATGAQTEMGRIAGMLGAVQPAKSPLQKEVSSLTIRLAVIAWVAVAVIVALGLYRQLDPSAVVLLGITTAISSIPAGLPTFLNGMLSFGAQRLARANAVVKSLNDVETLGSTTAINSDKTGTLTMDMMTATRMWAAGQWFTIAGSGYGKQGTILHAAGRPEPDFTALAYGLSLSGDAVVGADGTVVGDPTEAALVVLAAKMGVDAGESRRAYPRIAQVPFDSAYKFMATFHQITWGDDDVIAVLVKGAPDVVLARSTALWVADEAQPLGEGLSEVEDANRALAEEGLRVMSFAVRLLSLSERDSVIADPMAAVRELAFVALVGIIDPLRPSARDAIAVARSAGIDVRMITGDHAITATAIARDLGLGPGVITGPELGALSDEQVVARLPELHVFGRVSPQDKLRMVELMQSTGDVVAMTGDAVNDAAALKRADIGVAMGSGSDVTKQAAKMILVDDNFATLVHAIELGRDIYGKVSAQIRYVLTGLFGLLGIMLGASLLNINDGYVLTAIQLLFVSFFIGLFPALALSTDAAEAGLMALPPRDPRVPILNRSTAPIWLLVGLVQATCGLLPFAWQDMLGVTTAQTMTFATLALSTVWLAASMRRALTPIWVGPFVPFWLWMGIPLLLSVLAVELPFLQDLLGTTSLTGMEWLSILLLSLAVPLVSELAKSVRRRGAARAR